MMDVKNIEVKEISNREKCFSCVYDYHPNYRLCMDKYKNFPKPCYVPMVNYLDIEEVTHEHKKSYYGTRKGDMMMANIITECTEKECDAYDVSMEHNCKIGGLVFDAGIGCQLFFQAKETKERNP